MTDSIEYLAFQGQNLLASGSLPAVAEQLKRVTEQDNTELILLFDGSGRQRDLDLSGSVADVRRRYGDTGAEADAAGNERPSRPRGRPRLGVVGREVTLLPRHWEWLDQQRGGASAALRRLIDGARRDQGGEDRIKRAQDSANRFMYGVAGNLPGFEEAVRALYAGDRSRFERETANWPGDIRHHARRFAAPAFD